ncbi:MAG: pyruvate kinase [Candidatus Phytoplasma cynodontis]|uniref:pyruvate kinase n=1 Tax='Cynodon dactylon' phytoplasma TaxID=295320 RepID=UPI00186B3ACE|nr:pyruvate kinase ['Cynodon dactylon' phytoplasma]WIA07641.1 MAG: pyruvate kinase [Candidatus Phytoplasma cynodontis]
MNKTKIICTIGPSTYNEEILEKMINSGLNIARFNFSHADYDKTKNILNIIKSLNQKLKTSVANLLDTKGPEIRTHDFDGEVTIEQDSLVKIASYKVLGNKDIFSVTYPNFYEELNIGNIIYLDDGFLKLEVIDKKNGELITKAKNTHIVKSRRGINVPNVDLKMNFISDKDYKDIVFAIENDYDYIAASFTRTAQDIIDIKNILNNYKNSKIKIIAKIENQSGIDNIDKIIEVADGVMVARGDLGIEIKDVTVPLYQSIIIQKCLVKGKPVIVATQMLESMQKNSRPTKAEISDVFNAVREGTSATMLSGESASGFYPIESTEYMKKINNNAEKTLNYEFFSKIYNPQNFRESLLLNAVQMSLNLPIAAIVVYNFEDAYNISKFHPSVPVFAFVSNLKESRLLSLNFSIYPILEKSELDYNVQILIKNNMDVNNLILVKDNNLEVKKIEF